jgi:hypothetical protein
MTYFQKKVMDLAAIIRTFTLAFFYFWPSILRLSLD